MRTLTRDELDAVSGGLMPRSRMATTPPTPGQPAPGDGNWWVTPLIGPNTLSYGFEASTPFGKLAGSEKQLSYQVQNALDNVTLGTSLSSTGIATGTVTLPDVGGTDFTVKASIASNGQPSGNVQFSENGLTASIGGSASAWNAGIGFTDGPYTGNVSYSSSTESYSLSFTGADVMDLFGTPVSVEFNVFGLGGSNPGGGFEVYAGGKKPNGLPGAQPNAVGPGIPLHRESVARSSTNLAFA